MKTSTLVPHRLRSGGVAGSIVALSLVFGACTKSDTGAKAASAGAAAAISEAAMGTSGFSEDSTVVPVDGVPADSIDPNVSAAQNEVVDKLVLTIDGGLNAWQTNVSVLPVAFIADSTLLRGVPSELSSLAPKATTQTMKRPALEEMASWLYGAGFKGDPLDFGDPGITDMPTTSLTFTIGGEFYRQSAYALGVANSTDGLNDEQQKNRANFATLVEFLSDPETAYGAANFGMPSPYRPTAYSLWGARYGVPVGVSPVPKLVKIPWPHTSISLASTEEQPTCLPVEEADSSPVAATFTSVGPTLQATTTAFEQPDGVLAELVLVPVYPGMLTCPPGEPYRIFA